MVASSSWLFVYMAALHVYSTIIAFSVGDALSLHASAFGDTWKMCAKTHAPTVSMHCIRLGKSSTVSITHCIHCRKPSTVNNALHSLLQALHSVNTHCIHRLRKSSAAASPPQSALTASPEYDVENSSFWLKSVYFLKPYTHHQNSAK